MLTKLKTWIRPCLKTLLVFGLAATLVFSQADGAMAARGGRIGGGSFRAPSRSYSPPSRSYRGTPGGGYYPGGGFGFPFILPFFGFGGFGGLFGIFFAIAIANFIIRSFRSASGEEGDGYGGGAANPTVSIARLQVGLLADARSLQQDLNRIAQTADTGSTEGLTQVLQESTLSLLRHPEYWAYAAAESDKTRLMAAEQAFNQLALAERSKFSEESLSNVNSQLKQSAATEVLPGNSEAQLAEAPGEYIVATLLVATQGNLTLPKVQNEQDVRKALSQIGAVASDQLLAVEVLWSPQAEGETLTSDEVIAEYPNLRLI
ncbi:DUF1517 domain-containing protein [Romeria aff. gracilis LEGE 07310]|uniref:DUF1517 domain-containing protein n=1 Tax=Vasconcelosia minhoensis LEGE 07310 TaxID=915328 RepID=A0A8J7ABZ2_9CYAN|nr:DUF1517 domain-containing protein [Romeria gracilis]MBE9080245.1 DUF1517 domain-containing protein [Romeria aff. gracilis LEGE 07310]